uniref:Uncharacterized protein n=1 Tax=Trichobilharzia regenti TaxID=157069 RepID=A0AA85KGB5_TRIRE|nr:unnamed protein product [Trichobilharzia regenti]
MTNSSDHSFILIIHRLQKKMDSSFNFYIGLSLALLSTIFIGTSFIFKKLALRRASRNGSRADRRDVPPAANERILLEEFGRLIDRVVEASIKVHIHPSNGIHTPGAIDDNEQGLTHSEGSIGPESLGGKGIGAVGVAAATAAAADVLQDDEDEEDEILNEMDVDDADDMKNAMYNLVGEPTLSRHQHSRSHFARRH